MMNLSAKSGKSALDLIEEATHILRSAPAWTLTAYYVGTIPCVVGFLYFWAEMSRSPFADQHVAEAALAATALFLWMKLCQSVFAQAVLAQVASRPALSWGARRLLRTFLNQAVIQPTGLFIVPLSLVLGFPFGWVYSFYQSATVVADTNSNDASDLARKAWKHATLWPLQNHIVIGAGFLFGLFVFLNWLVVSLSIPSLLKMLFGIENIFTRSTRSMLNTTFVTAMFGLTYLSVDPILKTVYVLRCFYGEALQSGEDLKANLKNLATASQHWIATFVVLSLLVFGSTATAQSERTSDSSEQSVSAVPAQDLDKQIDTVIHQSTYAWRMPRAAGLIEKENANKGIISRFLDNIGDMLRRTFTSVLDWIDTVLRRWLGSGDTDPAGRPGYNWMTSSGLLYTLLALAAILLAVFLFQAQRRRSAPIVSIKAEAIAYTPDVADESIGADQLPEDGWISLAQGLLERGEFRLAIRAFYLSTLAHLASHNLIAIAKFKSNRDYENELRRRAHSLPELLPVFEANVSTFERIWYGMHEANVELIHQFAANVERITGLKALRQL